MRCGCIALLEEQLIDFIQDNDQTTLPGDPAKSVKLERDIPYRVAFVPLV